ncbi:hypothetical protein J2W70_004123 [Pseudomonas koreensis]|uniref:hypothetical protein n=1 Tax=Pseudomonas koreensis TaxID=198620 RepID=UPI0028555318|nr:hypothetical protein [Pseudomonas koreensis]MDR7056730.1 hypothetical protein [Pseudomonas koreensis]
MTIKEMSVPALIENKPLALNAPSIPAAIANGGLRWQDLNDPESPVRVQIVLQPGAVQLNDLVELKWQELPAKSATVDANHLSTGVIPLDVDPADILEHADGLHTYQYFVTAAIGGQTDPSPPATVKVKRLLPGGNTGDDAGTEYINENLRAPTGVPPLIDDAIAEPGITLTCGVYDNMAVGDIIQCDWGGQRQTHPPLTTSEVGKPVDFRVEKGSLIAAPGRVIVRYDIRDEVNNWSRWSLHVTTDVEAGENLLAAPRVVDAVSGVIELVKLGNQDAKVQTPVYNERMDAGDRVYLYWLGYTAEGLEVKVELDKEVKTEDIGWPLDFDIPNDKVRAIAQGNAVVRYEVIPLVGTPRRSRRTTVQIIGQVEQLPAPSVAGIVGDVLDPSILPAEGALVRIEKHDLIEAGDTILLLSDGKTASGANLPHTVSIPVTGSGAANGIERRIPLNYITPLQGGTVTVSFTLTKSGGETLLSNQLPLQVKSLGAQLPKPTVDYAQGDTLDPEDVPADGTTVRVNYSPMETADRIDIHWDGLLDFTDWFQIPANWGGKEVEFPVAKTYVDLNNGQTVQAFYIVSRGGQPLPASAKQPLLIGSAVELDPPGIKEAIDNSLNPIAAKDTLTALIPAYDNMIGTQLSVTWAGTAGGGSHTTAPISVTKQEAQETPLPNSVVALNLNRPVTVTYRVIRNGTPQDSPPLTLAVQPIADGDANLPTPRIVAVTDGLHLDLTSFTGDTRVVVAPWPLIAVGQCLWVRCEGTDANGATHTAHIHQGVSVTGTANQSGVLPRLFLDKLAHKSEIRVYVSVNFDKVSNAAKAIDFPLRKYTVKATSLEIDTTLMELDGPQLYSAAAPIAPHYQKTVYIHPKAHETRQAQGGSPPYQYFSSNPTVASVDPTTGHVVSTGIGTARINVLDAKGANVSYDVVCENVYEVISSSPREFYYIDALGWLLQNGARFFPVAPSLTSSDPLAIAFAFSFQSENNPGLWSWAFPSSDDEGIAPTGTTAAWDIPVPRAGLKYITRALPPYPRNLPVIGIRDLYGK